MPSLSTVSRPWAASRFIAARRSLLYDVTAPDSSRSSAEVPVTHVVAMARGHAFTPLHTPHESMVPEQHSPPARSVCRQHAPSASRRRASFSSAVHRPQALRYGVAAGQHVPDLSKALDSQHRHSAL